MIASNRNQDAIPIRKGGWLKLGLILLTCCGDAMPLLLFGGEHSGDPATVVTLTSPPEPFFSTNLLELNLKPKVKDYRHEIETARQLRRNRDGSAAARMLVNLLKEEIPTEFKRVALFELALVAQDERQFPRAQQILAQYVQLFPQDRTVPEALLRQGLIYRQMGAHQMAISKFYAVMNTALGLKLDQFDHYKRLVLQAQTEIADTFYLQGKFPEAADYFGRLLKQNTPDLNRPQVHFKLIRSLSSLGRSAEVVAHCESFFEKHPGVSEVPELRFVCATAFKQLGRNSESVGQILQLLESQQNTAQSNPENWSYWQQRAGNDIANQLYSEGDYLRALQIYTHLAALNNSPEWQLPVSYQIGLIYERLGQPQKAAERFGAIANREKDLTPPLDPSLKTVIEMARWRKDHLQWQGRAELAVQSLHLGPVPVSSTNAP